MINWDSGNEDEIWMTNKDDSSQPQNGSYILPNCHI